MQMQKPSVLSAEKYYFALKASCPFTAAFPRNKSDPSVTLTQIFLPWLPGLLKPDISCVPSQLAPFIHMKTYEKSLFHMFSFDREKLDDEFC